MVKFCGLCYGKIMARKTKFFLFLYENVCFFAKFLARVI